jgi:hypothetical protein
VRTIVAEQDAPMEEVIAAYKEAKKPEPLLLRLDRRVRYWSDGAVIGSREFVHRIRDRNLSPGKQKELTHGQVSDSESLFILRKLRE